MNATLLPLALLALTTSALPAQQGPMSRGGFNVSPLAIGEPGIAWYTTWDTGLAEAKRSNRPIMFVAAATQCNGVPGVF